MRICLRSVEASITERGSYHDNSNRDQDPVARSQSARPAQTQIMLTKAGDPYGSSE